MSRHHERINYVEYPASDLKATKEFFRKAFGWTFRSYGDDYCSFINEGLNGGFYQADLSSTTKTGGALIVFYSDDLEASVKAIEEAGGKIVKPIFSFPGGRRFHFTEPSGNELAVWSDI